VTDYTLCADELSAPTMAAGSAPFRALVGGLIAVDALASARVVVDAAEARAAADGDVVTAMALRCARAQIGHREGRLGDAERDVAPLLAPDRDPALTVLEPLARRTRTMLLRARGDAEGAGRTFAPLRPLVGRHPLLRGQEAALLLDAGRDAEAADAFLLALDEDGGHGIDNPAVAPWRSGAAVALARLGERDRAVTLAAEEVALTRPLGIARALGRALSAWGTAQGGEEGLRAHAEAVLVLERSPARISLPYALLEQGRALRAAGQAVPARRPLGRAGQLAEELGLAGVLAAVDAELGEAGGRARRPMRRGVASLTPAERRIATLVAEGRTSPEVATRLGIGRRTVETSLEKIFRKLDIHARTELRDAMAADDG